MIRTSLRWYSAKTRNLAAWSAKMDVRQHTFAGGPPALECRSTFEQSKGAGRRNRSPLRLRDRRSRFVRRDPRVLGVEGLRVIDGSIMPVLPRANTNLPCMAIGEHMAARLRPV